MPAEVRGHGGAGDTHRGYVHHPGPAGAQEAAQLGAVLLLRRHAVDSTAADGVEPIAVQIEKLGNLTQASGERLDEAAMGLADR